MISEESKFPNEIDPMFFFQDVDLEHVEQMNEYNSLVAQGKLDEAETYLQTTDGLHGYFAQYFNAFENRLNAIQTYVKEIKAEADANDPGTPVATSEVVSSDGTFTVPTGSEDKYADAEDWLIWIDGTT